MNAHVVFLVSGRLCALPVSAVREVAPMAALTRPPGLPPLIEGFLDLAGNAVAVVSLARLFDLPPAPLGRSSALLLLRHQDLALLVDEVRAVAAEKDAPRRPVADEASFHGCVVAELAVGDERAALLAADRLLLREEAERLRQFREIEQRRLDAAQAAEPPAPRP